MGEPARKLVSFEEDPLLRALQGAPMGPPLTAAERAAMDEGKRSIAAGERGRSQEDIERTLQRMREEQGDAVGD